MTSLGAEPAYRGYRLQALYAISRILGSASLQHLVFQSEGREDLAIFNESHEELIEAVQVKALSENLAISEFSPDKPDSFFRRAAELARIHPRVAITVVSFGPIGPEMTSAWASDGNERRAIAHKLLDAGFSSDDIGALFQRVRLVKIDEDNLAEGIFTTLRDSAVGGDVQHAFDLLHYWLYLASEKREVITHGSLISKINSIGQYLADRAAHHREWFISIVPIEDRQISEDEHVTLGRDFYQGIAAQYEHILAKVDVVRDDKLKRIESAFHESRIVIVHGASGQGKSTLAYRYLHDSVPSLWRFAVKLVANRVQALTVFCSRAQISTNERSGRLVSKLTGS